MAVARSGSERLRRSASSDQARYASPQHAVPQAPAAHDLDVALMASPAGTWHELAAMLLRRPRPSAAAAARLPSGMRFGTERGPGSSILVPVCVIAMLGDLPCSMVLVSVFHPAHPLAVHAAILSLALASLGWAMAACSARRALPHVLTDATLLIRDGFDLAIDLPRHAVVSAQALDGSRRVWMAERGLTRDSVLRASLLDAPNLAIEIDPTALATSAWRRGRVTPPRRWILLYADAPAALLSVLNRRHVPASVA